METRYCASLSISSSFLNPLGLAGLPSYVSSERDRHVALESLLDVDETENEGEADLANGEEARSRPVRI